MVSPQVLLATGVASLLALIGGYALYLLARVRALEADRGHQERQDDTET